MKKFLKGLILSCLVLVCVFGFTACKDPISTTSTDTSKVAEVNGVSTNGGITTIYGDYLYFINGTKTNDGKSASGNTRSAICRVKINKSTGEIDGNTYEVIVRDLVGFKNSSLYFFGDFMYYTVPSADVNSKDEVQYNKTKFNRYDLVNGKSYTIYTTQKNDSNEELNYAYYVSGSNLNLVVYEKASSTITSIKVDENPVTNYVINDVTSCVLSENNGKVVTANNVADANSYVYYTVANANDGTNKIYRTAPSVNNSLCLTSNFGNYSILTIISGKLVYSVKNDIEGVEQIYAQMVDNNTTALDISFSNVISHLAYENIVFADINNNGNISIIYYDTKTYDIVSVNCKDGVLPETKTICNLSKYDNFSFVSLVTVSEEEKQNASDNGETQESTAEKVMRKVTYVTFIANNYLYKLEVARENASGVMEVSKFTNAIKLSETKVQNVDNMLVPKVVGDYIYFFVNEQDSNKKDTGHIYMYRTKFNITESASSSDKPEFVGVKEADE